MSAKDHHVRMFSSRVCWHGDVSLKLKALLHLQYIQYLRAASMAVDYSAYNTFPLTLIMESHSSFNL